MNWYAIDKDHSGMKLSEAIRLGAMLRPQAFGALFQGEPSRSCAFGAAMEAIGVLTPGSMLALFSFDAPVEWMLSTQVRCGACDGSDTLMRVITHLNDVHLWTREAIADFVERVEQQQSQAEDVAAAV